MSYTIQVRMKKLGKQRANSLAPVPFVLESRPQTTRDLITALTALGVKSELLNCLTKEEIEDKAQSGRIGFGVNYGGRKARLSTAQENALQCFEDGIYRIFAGETELTALNDEIPQANDTVFTFIRLTMLSGW